MTAPGSELEEAFQRDFVEHLLPAAPVEGVIRSHRAWFVMSALQLALRHPHFPESIRQPVEAFARRLQAIVSLTPTLTTVAEMGWHQQFDPAVPVSLEAEGRATSPDALLEALADAEHASWSRWMVYLFETCQQNANGSVTIPPELVKRWDRQANTPYAALSEGEKESDREEVRRILPLLRGLAPAPEAST